MNRATFDGWIDDPKMFMVENAEGDTFPIRFIKAHVVVTTAAGDKVAFGKTSRGQNYWDSRGKKVKKKNEWGDETTVVRPLMISESEVRSELERLLGDRWEAARAMQLLSV